MTKTIINPIPATLIPTDIRELQTRLNQLGYGPLDVDGIYGKHTILSVKLFQSHHCYPHGRPLKVDGIVGPLTWWSLFDPHPNLPETDSPLLTLAIEIARQEVGVREDPPGSNSGPRINEYLRSTHVNPGNPWCAAFVYWVFEQASARLNRVNPLVKTASCLCHWHLTKGFKITGDLATRNNTLIQPGSIFILKRGDRRGHTGIVIGLENGILRTIEGNSNPLHSPEGIGVFALERKIETINCGFIIYN